MVGNYAYLVVLLIDSSDRVYITEEFKPFIFLFSTDGELITSFGIYNSILEELNNLDELAVDSYGAVYANDKTSGKIQKFV